MSSKADRIRELEEELAELRAEERVVPLTLKQIRAMSPEQIKAEMKRLRRERASEADDAPTPFGPDRIKLGYADDKRTPMEVRNARRGKGPKQEADDGE